MNRLNNVDAINGTSFHGHTITATVRELCDVLGDPDCENNDGMDKVNFEWFLETADGEAITLYDWKEYRSLGMSEVIEWHIGGHSTEHTENAMNELMYLLNSQRFQE